MAKKTKRKAASASETQRRIGLRPTLVEKQQRVDLAVDMLLKGQTRQFVLTQFSIKYALVPRVTDRYIRRAKRQITEAAVSEVDFRLAQALLRYDDLYFRNYSLKDYRECRGVQESTNKLLGLNAPEKKDINHTGSLFDLFMAGTGTPATTDDTE